MPAKAGTQGQPTLRLRPWAPAFAGATRKGRQESAVWLVPLAIFVTAASVIGLPPSIPLFELQLPTLTKRQLVSLDSGS